MLNQHESTAQGCSGLGVDAYRLRMIAQGFKGEALGFRLTAKAPPMCTIVMRDYGMKVKRSKPAKEEAAKLFLELGDRLHSAINNNETQHIEKLAAVRDNGPEFIRILMEMLN